MISAQMTKRQVARLLRLPFAPSSPEDLRGVGEEFQRVLRACCADDQHCLAVVDAVIDAIPRMPAPADIVEKAREIPARDTRGPMGCQTCHGTGWEVFDPPGRYSYVDFCKCERGRWMKESEQQREHEKASKKGRYDAR